MAKFFIFGDSHAGNLARSAQSLKLDFAGGSIMAGMHMNDSFFKVEDGIFKMATELGIERLGKRLRDAGLGENFLDTEIPILSTVGFNTTNFGNDFCEKGLAITGSKDGQLISTACFEAVVVEARKGALEFYSVLASAGKPVFAVLSPQRFSDKNATVCRAFENVMMRELTARGVKIIDVRAETTAGDGVLLPELASPIDSVHANEAYGGIVLQQFLDVLN